MCDGVVKDILLDIDECIDIISARIERFDSADAMMENDDAITVYDAIVMRLQVLGELVKSIDKRCPKLLQKYNSIDWNAIIRFRDKISHHYLDLDAEIVYDIAKNHIPLLKEVVAEMMEGME